MKRVYSALFCIFLLFLIAGCGGSSSSTSGTGVTRISTDWGFIMLYDNSANIPYDYMVLLNNVWNKGHAAPGPQSQNIFTETIDGKTAFGWQWNWAMSEDVVAYPEVIYGAKPWDTGDLSQKGGQFPFHAGSMDVTANFDIRLEAEGTYNMAFSMWAISDLETGRASITHEVMIWNYNHGCTPAGTKQGSLTVNGVVFDVFVQQVQQDHSDSTSQTWKYVAFEAQSNILQGPLDIGAFIDYMIAQGIMTTDVYICNVELGNEIVGGHGITEIKDFSVTLQPRD